MGMYGPFAAVVNTVQTQKVDTNADRLFIVNQSIYDLVIGFGDQAPPFVATLTGDPWVATVPPGGQLVPIRRDLYGGGVFSGKVHILALDPTSGKLGLTGTTSSNAAYFVQSLQPGEPAPETYSIPQFQNLASQPRIVVVPTAANYLTIPPYSGSVALPAAGSSVNLMTDTSVASLVGPNARMVYYLDHLVLSTSNNAGAAGAIDATIALDLQTAGNVSVGGSVGVVFPQTFLRIGLDWPAAAGPYPKVFFFPPRPLAFVLALTPGHSIDHVALIFINNSSINTPTSVKFSAVLYPDTQNYSALGSQAAPEPIGRPNFVSGALF